MLQRIPPRILAYKNKNKQRRKHMNIINQSRELTKMEQYKLTKSKKAISVKDAVGLSINVDAWCIYEDHNQKDETVQVLAVMDTEGSVYTTVSEVFTRSFLDIVETFGDDMPPVEIIDGTTKSGRTYYDCTVE